MQDQRITFSGYYGMMNFGDDLFGYVAHHAQRRYWAGRTSRILSPPIDGLDADFVVPRRLRWRYGGSDAAGRFFRLYYTTRVTLDGSRLVHCGGSIFTGRRGIRTLTSRITSSRQSAIGVSIGPFGSASGETRDYAALRGFEFIAVRDRLSFELARVHGLRTTLAADIAGLLPLFASPSAAPAPAAPAPPKLAFMPCGNESTGGLSGDELCLAFVRSAARMHAMRPLQVTVIVLNHHPASTDAALAAKTAALLAEAGIPARLASYGNLGIQGTIDEICSARLVVSGRLHGAIVAYVYGIPFVMNEYHRKCIDFLDDVGIDPRLRAGSDSLATAMSNALDAPPPPGVAPAAYMRRAELNFTAAPWTDAARWPTGQA